MASGGPPFPVVGVGASAGGVEALQGFCQALPPQVQAAVLVVLHIPAHSSTQLDAILGEVAPWPVTVARDGEAVEARHVYVAVPDRHLMLDGTRVRLSRGPKECRVRPAVDVLFRSLALACGPRAAGVVLSGMLDDGTAGLWAIKEAGGGAFAQHPAEAQYPSMPSSAAEHVAVDAVKPLAALAADVGAWCDRVGRIAPATDPQPRQEGGMDKLELEVRIAAEANALRNGVMQLGQQSQYTCPDCHGVLVEIREGRVIRYRCHTGHAFSVQTLLAEVDTAIDNGLWDTIRALEERLLLLRQLAGTARDAGEADRQRHFEGLAAELEKPIERLRTMVLDPRLFGHETAG